MLLNIDFVEASIDTKFDEDGDPLSLEMGLETSVGESRSVRAEVLKSAVLPFGEKESLSLMHETLAKHTMDGVVSYGIAEYQDKVMAGPVGLAPVWVHCRIRLKKIPDCD